VCSVLRCFADFPPFSELRSTARQIDKSKRTEFVCPSSTRPLSTDSEQRLMARQIQSNRTEFVCPSVFPSAVWLRSELSHHFSSRHFYRIRTNSNQKEHQCRSMPWRMAAIPHPASADRCSAGGLPYRSLLLRVEVHLQGLL
jgi:hypothetical protein